MELRQLSYFVAVAEECHFTRAAKRLHVAQSGLSASVRSLERELGADLFVRNTRQVRLTPAGAALLAEARRTLAASDACVAAVAAVQGLLRGTLAIGSLQCLHVVHLPAVLAGFVSDHPGLDVELRQGGSGELTALVAQGKLDVAFVSRPAAHPEEVVVGSLATEPLVLACAHDHPLARADRVSPATLTGERFVDFAPDWGTRDLVDSVVGPRHVALEVTDVHSLLDLVACGLGVALVPQSFSVKTDRVRFVGLTLPAPHWETVSVTANPPSAAAVALVADVRRSAGLTSS
ncbi:LysR family transcriptional regulator [Actinophytocola algeriensis]|uniref:DNA-binding transcriptional LysR family regulator n=1 Tax=Actinophytocola algeriensis TaxID=1768010 RepID=A0A7W7QEI7_9PSEU|nr:LysR family transcriptional regulator [Actinophytocola algeriensis]MBB4912186.1 DNA-binding transcriptional LysR family regulator [Actinophytocola algeriensis]MBE1474298.1 DNA-binding transcriptional LysR family regulator [Actinophytocola algeriensis]